MNVKLAHLFFLKASKILGFLVTEHNFQTPMLNIDSSIGFATVTFMAKNIAIECVFDEPESDVTCKVCRLESGKKVDYYAVDKDGDRVRDDIASLLRRRGVRDRLFTKLNKGMEIQSVMRIVLSDYAEMLKKHGQDILDDCASVFGDPSRVPLDTPK